MRLIQSPAGRAWLLALLAPVSLAGQGPAPAVHMVPWRADSVPADLRPLLVAPQSEMRLVALRYTQDRSLLASNYIGYRPGGRGGRGGPSAPDTGARPLDVSPARAARLARFDSAWAGALAAVDRDHLSAAGQAGLDSLRTAVTANRAAASYAQQENGAVDRLTFVPPLVHMLERRIHLVDVNAEGSAGTLNTLLAQIADTRRAIDSAGPDAISHGDAERIAATAEMLRGNLGEWFRFYNGYDPLFTWWLGIPYRHADTALQSFVMFARDTLAASGNTRANDRVTLYQPRPAAPAPGGGKLADVPDLTEIIGLPQDEMSEVVRRYVPRASGRGNASAPPAPVRDSAFYTHWLTALHTLDFDKLSRNAQVDYLYVRANAENELARVGHPLPANPPRLADKSGIPGAARGRDGLIRDLQDEFIPYTPEQLEVLAEREFAITQKEMLKASHEMGYGDNWKAAVEKVKTEHVPPGGQPGMVRDLIYQAIDYVRANNLVTVPEVASESMHMTMMSAQAQLSNPFFLGGSQIQVAYPTDSMEFEAREEAMRGNNLAFAHATAFHEMIPGHNLSFYVNARYRGYRANLGLDTPFYVEGWALYWELTLYDKGFDTTPEERVGALFWRMHRCARIIFSLKFHMGEWSPQQAIDFLVDRVGHERDNATAEVRRSFQGGYSPLYQAGYLLGGLELRSLRHELVDSKQMTERAFHDEILRQGSMPIALLRLALTKQRLTRDMPVNWTFYGDLPDH